MHNFKVVEIHGSGRKRGDARENLSGRCLDTDHSASEGEARMSTTYEPEKRTGTEILSGPQHNYLGRDADGDYHHYDRRAGTVTVITPAGTREYQHDVEDLSTWAKFVHERRGWADLRLIDLSDFAVEGALR